MNFMHGTIEFDKQKNSATENELSYPCTKILR